VIVYVLFAGLELVLELEQVEVVLLRLLCVHLCLAINLTSNRLCSCSRC